MGETRVEAELLAVVTLCAEEAGSVLDEMAGYYEVRRVSSVSGQLHLIVEVEVPSIDTLNTLRDLIAPTRASTVRRDIERAN